MRKKNKVGGITIPDIKLYYKATVIKTAWYWDKNRHIDQWNRVEGPEINPYLYGQLIFDKEGRNIKWSKNSLFNKWCWRSGQLHAKKNETRLLTYPIHKNILKMDLNIGHDTLKVLEENTGRKISDIPFSYVFTTLSPRAKGIKERINKWDFIKLKSFWLAKENIRKMKREGSIWENIFASVTLKKG